MPAAPLPDPAVGVFAWLDGDLVPASDVRRLELGERAALFCERTQQLVELNPTADLIWRSLASGASPRAVARQLETLGAPAADALQFATQSVWAWLEAGLMLPAEVQARVGGPPDIELHLRIGGFASALGLHGAVADPLVSELDAVFGQFYAAPAREALRLSVIAEAGQYFLLLGQAPRGLFAADRIVPELKAVLTEQLSRSVGGGAFLLHAALLAHGGNGLLITGAPGAGKTTLTVALAARGFGYASDDIVKVSADGALQGVRFSPASKSGGWPFAAPYVRDLRQRPAHRRGDGQLVRYIPVGSFASGEVDALGWVVLLDRRADGPPALEPVEPMAMLTELLGAAFSADHAARGDVLQAFSERLARAVCRRLVYADLEGAVGSIEALVGG